MGFNNYKTVEAVLKEFQIIYTQSNFIVEVEFHVPEYFREDLEIIMKDGAPECSELAMKI